MHPALLRNRSVLTIAMTTKKFISIFFLTIVTGYIRTNAVATAPLSCSGPCHCEGRVATCDNAQLTTIPGDLPENLEILRISRSQLTGIEGLNRYKSLTELTLTRNEITALPTNSFAANKRLTTINLQRNRLRKFDIELWSNVTNLRQLDLSFNEITDIETRVLTGWPVGNRIRRLSLRGNKLKTIKSSFLNGLRNLNSIDLRGNVIDSISNDTFAGTSNSLLEVDISENHLCTLPNRLFNNENRIEVLKLNNNNLTDISNTTLANLRYLRSLYVAGNRLKKLNPGVFDYQTHLIELSLSNNDFTEIPALAFRNNLRLKTLDLSHLPKLTRIDATSFRGLANLETLKLNDNRKLSLLNEDVFKPLVRINTLSLQFNNHSSLYKETFQPIFRSLKSLSIHNNPLRCNCAVRWIRAHAVNSNTSSENAFNFVSVRNIRCQYPDSLMHRSIIEVDNLTCVAANVTSHTSDTSLKIGKSAMLECTVTGDPLPMIEWRTPRGQIFRHDDYLTNAKNSKVSHLDVQSHWYHKDHAWHDSDSYSHNTSRDRVKILDNGYLFIDYVERSDAGRYTCMAKNPAGNVTVAINIKLNYLVIKDITIASLIVGFSSAGVFFGLGIVISIVRYIRRKCSENERRRKSMRNILDTLDQYKSLQLDKLDKMRDNYGGHVSKIKENCIVQMDRMRENYCTQIAKIRDNCASQMDKLRENYNNQMSRIKDYSSHQIDKIRENYNNQMIKIRDYGANQLEKLRETYKLQHQHLIKILETMNMDNCRGIMESECYPNDQLFMAANFDLDPSLKRLSHDSVSDSEFVTACSDSDGISLDLLAGIDDEAFAPETISMHELEPVKTTGAPDEIIETREPESIKLIDTTEAVVVDVGTIGNDIDSNNPSSEEEDEMMMDRNNDSSEDSDSTPTLSVTSPQIHIAPKGSNSPSADEESPSSRHQSVV